MMLPVKIGVTIGEAGQIWSNGLHQNAFYLAKLLRKCGHRVDLLGKVEKFVKYSDVEGLSIYPWKRVYEKKYDIILSVSLSPPPDIRDLIRKNNPKTKFVAVQYGNLFEMTVEDFLGFRACNSSYANEYDDLSALWISPHFTYTLPWLKSIFKHVPIHECPYVWESSFFDARCEEFEGDPNWTPDIDMTKIAMHEPNINVMKNCIIPLAIVGELNDKHPEMVSEVFALNTEEAKANVRFINYIKQLGLMEKGSFDSRRTTPFMVTQNVMGVSVFNQRWCDLNYIYLELLKLGYPIVHNSEGMKEAGYYYPGIDVQAGAAQLKNAMLNHAENLEEYKKKADDLLWKYSTDNPDNIKGYNDLVKKVLDS